MKLVSIIGARPEFVQVAVLSRALRSRHEEIVIHTGQHYDDLMSDVFFRDLGLPAPDVNLEVGSGSPWRQVGSMLAGIGDELVRIDPDLVIVRGDTSSTIAGALAARQGDFPIAHVEAGMRSYDLTMPEEVNRVVTDHIADVQFVTDDATRQLLEGEGVRAPISVVGDVMYDTYLATVALEPDASPPLGLAAGAYDVLTIHRQENTDDASVLRRLVEAFATSPRVVLFPVHPRTAARIAEYGIALPASIRATEPLGYREMLAAERGAYRIYTDSGGVQREAYFAGKECVTLRDRTEWTNTVATGWNTLAGSSVETIRATFAVPLDPTRPRPPIFGHGDAAERILSVLDGGIVRGFVEQARRRRSRRAVPR